MVLPLGEWREIKCLPQDCKVGAVYGHKLAGATFDDMDACLKSLGNQYYRTCEFMPLGETTCKIVTKDAYEKQHPKSAILSWFDKALNRAAIAFRAVPPMLISGK